MWIIPIKYSSQVHVRIIHWKDKFIGTKNIFISFVFLSIVNRWDYINDKLDADCLSCDDANETCGYASAQFSHGKGNYYILECFGPSIPYSTLHNRTDKLGKKIF
jgi:hypothetical protein